MTPVGQIQNFLGDLLEECGHPRTFSAEESLFQTGKLDSIYAVRLIVYLERQFNLRYDESFSITRIDNFSGILREVCGAPRIV